MEVALHFLTLAGALGCGLIGGVFFAFSAFVMRALGRLPPGQAVAAMQAINIAVIGPGFLGVFLGTAAACAGLLLHALLTPSSPQATWYLVAGALYLVGSFGVTLACNVPRNNQLAGARADDPGAEGVWMRYTRDWTRWNHVRAAASLLAAAALCRALAGG